MLSCIQQSIRPSIQATIQAGTSPAEKKSPENKTDSTGITQKIKNVFNHIKTFMINSAPTKVVFIGLTIAAAAAVVSTLAHVIAGVALAVVLVFVAIKYWNTSSTDSNQIEKKSEAKDKTIGAN